MKKTTVITIIVIILLAIIGFSVRGTKQKAGQAEVTKTPSNLNYKNTSYVIGAQNVYLNNGVSEVEVVPGTKAVLTTKVFGNEVKGDFNGDNREDVAFIVIQSGNGSGTFYYAAVALQNQDGSFKGTNAVFLGDRVAPQNILYSSGVLAVNYVDRKAGESFTTAPSVGMTKFLTLDLRMLKELTVGKGERLVAGNIVWGAEVREFTPCGEKANWIVGESPAYKDIKDVYTQVIPTSTKPYKKVFGVLIGKTAKPPKTGFGADYKTAFLATQLVNMNPSLTCK